LEDVKVMTSVAILNLAMCRYHCHHINNNNHKDDHTFQHNWFDVVNTIDNSSALSLCNFAISNFDHPIFHLRKVEILIKMHLYIEALAELNLLSTWLLAVEAADKATKRCQGVLVGDYGKNRVLSQLYLTGLTLPLIHTAAENDDKISDNADFEVDQALIEISSILNRTTTAGKVDLNELHHKISLMPKSDCQVSKEEWQEVITVTRKKLEFLCRQHGLSH